MFLWLNSSILPDISHNAFRIKKKQVKSMFLSHLFASIFLNIYENN